MALSEPAEFGHPDFILLEKANEAAFMANLKLRFEKGKVRNFPYSGEIFKARICSKSLYW